MQIRDRIKELRRVKASELLPNPANWRRHPAAQQDALRGVLAEVGYADALIARELPDGRLMLLDGHCRAETTPDSMVPVLVLDVSEAEARLVLATLDPLAAMAETDDAAFRLLISEVETKSEGLQAMLDELAGPSAPPASNPDTQAAEIAPDRAGELREKWQTAFGQVWGIPSVNRPGRSHRIMCGDSTDCGDVLNLMAGAKVSLCFTSPPYAQQRDYTQKIENWDALMQGAFANLPLTANGQILVNLGLVHKDGEWQPYWQEWIEWMRMIGLRRFAWYIWDQGAGLPGDWSGRFAPCHEFVFHFNRESVRPEKILECDAGNVERGRKATANRKTGKPVAVPMSSAGATGEISSTERNAYKIPDSIIRVSRKVGSDGHPASFSVGFPAFIIRSWPGDVYDPFIGSGTTMIAAEREGQICYGMELAPEYLAIALERLKAEGLDPALKGV